MAACSAVRRWCTRRRRWASCTTWPPTGRPSSSDTPTTSARSPLTPPAPSPHQVSGITTTTPLLCWEFKLSCKPSPERQPERRDARTRERVPLRSPGECLTDAVSMLACFGVSRPDGQGSVHLPMGHHHRFAQSQDRTGFLPEVNRALLWLTGRVEGIWYCYHMYADCSSSLCQAGVLPGLQRRRQEAGGRERRRPPHAGRLGGRDRGAAGAYCLGHGL